MGNKKIILSFTTAITAILCVSAAACLLFTEHGPFVDFWLTPDQQAQRCFDHGDHSRAAGLFTDFLRRGVSLYAAEEFEGAAAQFSQVETAEGFFNLGNAYCHLERIPEAIEVYQQALSLQPDYPDAQFNLEFAQLLLPPKRPDDAPDSEPSFDADEIRFDNTENKGTPGEVEEMQLSDDQIADLWMRRVQTTPADFLRVKFSYDTHVDSSQ